MNTQEKFDMAMQVATKSPLIDIDPQTAAMGVIHILNQLHELGYRVVNTADLKELLGAYHPLQPDLFTDNFETKILKIIELTEES